MIRSILLVAALLALAEGAALVRFINTVPTRSSQESVTTASAANAAPSAIAPTGAGAQPITDRVGLQYFSEASNTITSPTLVWTTILDSGEQTGVTAPFAWVHAMPPLRAYHTVKGGTAEAVAVDKPFGGRPGQDTANNGISVGNTDVYVQTRLRADGVGLYLSFAAGTYRMQAYAALATTLAESNAATARAFQDSSISFTLADNKVYTIIAFGQGRYSEATVLSGNNVRLVLLEESTAAVPFGLASVRFFNAFANTASTMDVYQGTGVSDAGRIASGIAVGSVSEYIDVTPGVAKEFPVAVSGTTANNLASSTNVQRDVRAGSRTTIICGITNEATATGYCRGIPSRAVAYVRLIHDAASQDALVQGMFGAQKLSQTKLSLWAQYDVPRPEIVAEASQVHGTSIVTSHPATQQGLYPVVVNVNPGVVSGYGEVHVPLYIMDWAVRSVITAAVTTAAFSTSNEVDYAAGATRFLWTPIFKRVHYVLKTDGFATLSAKQPATPTTLDPSAVDNYVFSWVGTQQQYKDGTPATGTHNLQKYVTLDEYVEAGEYYSVFATAAKATTVAASANVAGASPVRAPYALQRSDIISVYYRRDRSIDTISAGIATGKGVFNLVPFAQQTFNPAGSSLAIQLSASNTVATNPALATVGIDRTQQAATTPISFSTANYDTTAAEIVLTAGSYTYSYTGGAGCSDRIPSSSAAFQINDGAITDLFVLNQYGCLNNQNDIQRLALVIQQRSAASASGHAPTVALREDAKRHAVPLTL